MRISDWSSDVCSSDLGFEGFGQRRLAQLRSQCDLRQADDRNADFTGRAFGDAAVHRRGGIDHGVDRAVGVDQIADHAFVAASSAAFRAAIVLGLSSNSRNSGGKGLSQGRSEEHTSELQSLMRTSYAVFC